MKINIIFNFGVLIKFGFSPLTELDCLSGRSDINYIDGLKYKMYTETWRLSRVLLWRPWPLIRNIYYFILFQIGSISADSRTIRNGWNLRPSHNIFQWYNRLYANISRIDSSRSSRPTQRSLHMFWLHNRKLRRV